MPPEEEKSQKPLIIAGIIIVVVFVIAIGLVVKFKPQWLGGKAQITKLQQQGLPTSTTGIVTSPVTTVAKNTPAPTPNLGPGPWACDPLGICNRYGDTTSASGCPKTFADTNCLNQCGDKSVQCAKF